MREQKRSDKFSLIRSHMRQLIKGTFKNRWVFEPIIMWAETYWYNPLSQCGIASEIHLANWETCLAKTKQNNQNDSNNNNRGIHEKTAISIVKAIWLPFPPMMECSRVLMRWEMGETRVQLVLISTVSLRVNFATLSDMPMVKDLNFYI